MVTKTKLVTVLRPFLYGKRHTKRGEVIPDMDSFRADVLSKKTPPFVAFGEVELPDVPDSSGSGAAESVGGASRPEAPEAPAGFVPESFPGGELLFQAGIRNVGELRERVSAGDNWFKGIAGVGKKAAAEMVSALDALTPETEN